MLQCPYCEEDAETCGHWDSFGDCRFYLGKVAPMISDLKARVAELEVAHQWQPIETAPKDVVVLGCEGNWIGPVMCYGDNGWIDDEGETCHPTHWMPLPEAPK